MTYGAHKKRPKLTVVGAAMLSDPVPAPDPLALARRGNYAVFRKGETNHCPNCGRSHWHVGRTSAECAFCQTALPFGGGAS